MPKFEKKKILAVLEDLLFTVKINDVAKRNGLDVEFVKSERDAIDKAKTNPMLIILDLNSRACRAKTAQLRSKPLIRLMFCMPNKQAICHKPQEHWVCVSSAATSSQSYPQNLFTKNRRWHRIRRGTPAALRHNRPHSF